MNSVSSIQPEIWRAHSEICPDFAKSGILSQSGIWIFPFSVRYLSAQFQISVWDIRNLIRNLDFSFNIKSFCQIPDFGKSTPKGVGGLPATGGESHHLPPGKFRALKSRPEPHPTTAAGTAKHQPPSSSTRAAHQKRRPLMADTTLATAAIGATPETHIPPETGRTILALDLGTTTGWAIRGFDGLITSGTASFRPGRYDGGGMRYLRFTNWLTELDRLSGPIATIWFEEVRRHAGTDASHVYGGLMATLTSWAELRGVPYQGVPVGTIKRHTTGKGNANKQAMIDAARARGFSPADDNEADAIAILLWAIETQGGVA